MNAQYRNHTKNIAAALEHLNEAVGPTHRYRIRREGDSYTLVSALGAEYAPRSAMEIRETLLSLRIAATGR